MSKDFLRTHLGLHLGRAHRFEIFKLSAEYLARITAGTVPA